AVKYEDEPAVDEVKFEVEEAHSNQMLSVPDRYRKCESCHVALSIPRGIDASPASRSFFLGCGHIICARCRKDNGTAFGKVWCRSCLRFCECSVLPTATNAQALSFLEANRVKCSDHPKYARDMQCPCGEMICRQCVNGSHSDHSMHEELQMIEIKMAEEWSRMRLLKETLTKEKIESAKEKREIDQAVCDAKNRIASKCTLIIAQTISRCLDLMSQMEKVRMSRAREVRNRDAVIENTIGKIEKATNMWFRSKMTPNLSARLDMQKEAIVMANCVTEEYNKMKSSPKVGDGPLMRIVYSRKDDDVILNNIAKLGKVITTNLIDGNTRQVETMPTPLLRLPRICSSDPYTNFHKALIWEERLDGIEYAASAMVVKPPLRNSIEIVPVKSADDLSGRATRFKLTCSNGGAAPAAVAATVMADATAANVVNNIKKVRTPILKGQEPLRTDVKKSQIGTSDSLDQPGPSSP
ncbi:hypothetical protein PFISCL1PPCAC_21537, partial [Pristionchus fissidentatus]